MEIIRELQPRQSLEAFADEHGLKMRVVERFQGNFYAHFDDAEVKDDGVLIGLYGNGKDEIDAISDYANAVSEKTLVIGARTPERREIRVPILHYAAAAQVVKEIEE